MSQSRSIPRPPGGPPRVLVVDDEPSVRQAVAAVLREEGYDARAAANGAEGLAYARTWRPDVVLLDLVMPYMHGWAFAEAYHRLPGPHAPIVAMTGFPPAAADRAAAELGAVEVLPKPLDVERLLETVGYLARYRAA
jgi:CheY-like chemotaxis protein